MIVAKAGEIDAIHAHLRAGHEIAIVTYGHCAVLDSKHVDYIRADGNGYRLGWPGQRSVYTFPDAVRYVPADHTIKTARRRRGLTAPVPAQQENHTMTDYTSILDGVTQEELAATGGSSGHTPYDVPYIQIDDDGAVFFGVRTIYGHSEGIPERIYRGVDRRYNMSGNPDVEELRADLADGGAIAVLIDRIKTGHSTVWDGNNTVGQQTEDAVNADDELNRLLSDYAESGWTAWDVRDWLAGLGSDRAILDGCGLTDMSGPDAIVTVAEDLIDDARNNKVVLTGDVVAYLTKLRDRVRQDAEYAEDEGA